MVIKNISKIIAILMLGAIGGLLFQVFVLPYLIAHPYFERFQFVKNFKEREIIINPIEEIIIRENIALEQAIETVEKTVVGIQTKTKSGKILEGSGLVVTSDGLVVTFADLVPAGSDISFFVEGEEIQSQILKRDSNENLALVKLEKLNLTTCSFADLEKIKLGEIVFLIGVIFEKTGSSNIVNAGIIKSFSEDYIRTNMFEKKILNGSPLFDIEGNVLGLNTIDEDGKVIAFPIDKIKSFAGF